MRFNRTFFAPAQRATPAELNQDIDIVSKNPVISGLLESTSGLLAIVNEHRQIVAVNDALLKALGIEDPLAALGLRPGESLQCIHAQEEPAGCGTTKACISCGAAIAMVTSLGQDQPTERTCALTVARGGRTLDLALQVRSQPIKIGANRFLLLFLQDITRHQQRAALERTFFHDINNMLSTLVGASELLVKGKNQETLANLVLKTTLGLAKEVEIQRCLLKNDICNYIPAKSETTTNQIQEELQAFFSTHLAATDKHLEFIPARPTVRIYTDLWLVLRILGNMITNALEASAENDHVKIWFESDGNRLACLVWNRQVIPDGIAQRIFQRNFSTKPGEGHGLGTFSMKLFGEAILGGKVGFSSSEELGTTFQFSLPLKQEQHF